MTSCLTWVLSLGSSLAGAGIDDLPEPSWLSEAYISEVAEVQRRTNGIELDRQRCLTQNETNEGVANVIRWLAPQVPWRCDLLRTGKRFLRIRLSRIIFLMDYCFR